MENVIFVSACSGHAFKHSAAIGEALAQWLVEGKSRLDLNPFRLARFRP
jgi:sarcosine oxidase